MQEKIIEVKTCKHCNSSFNITDWDLNFYEKISPSFASPSGWSEDWGGVKKYLIPSPTLCPDCRNQSRLVWRNERKLYHRKSDFNWNQIISIYSPDKDVKVFESDMWHSDKWNPLDYWKNFDFEKSFFEQFYELDKKVPKLNLVVFNNENSPYTNFVTWSKNIYLSWDVMNSQDLYYSNIIKNVANCSDLLDIQDSSNCYECIWGRNLNNCFYVYWSKSCYKSMFLYDCENVNESLFCVNLRNKKNYILNKEVTNEEYKKVLELIKQDKYQKYLNDFQKLLNESPKKNLRIENSENCYWELTSNSKNCFDSYLCESLENCKYMTVWQNMYLCMDTTIHNPECYLDYMAISWWKLKNAIWNIFCWDSNNLYYSNSCFFCSNCFWCSSLKNKEYCILNKQFSKEEYENLVPKIIEHMKNSWEWGEFFPSKLSPFWYNETVAQEYFPLDKNEALKSWFNWSDYEKQNWYNWEYYIPLKIEEYDEKVVWKDIASKNIDELLKWILKCENSWKPYKIIKAELDFYIKHWLPIPKKHPDERHLDRLKLRNPRKLFDRNCDKCWIKIKTTYSPDRKEIVYCWSCYEKEIY